MPNGTRRAHTRNGRPVRSAPIKHPKAQQRRNQMSRQMQRGKSPLLWGAGIMAGWGALEAILAGRWITAGLLFGVAGGFLVTHAVWSRHKRRQASKPKRQTAKAERLQREKDAARRAGQEPAVQREFAAARAERKTAKAVSLR